MINLYDEKNFNLIYKIDKDDIQGCELAISDKAKCIGCKKIIAQGTPRLWINGQFKQPPPDEGIKKIKRFICYSCSEFLLKSRSEGYLKIIKEGKKAEKKLINENIISAKYLMFLNEKNVIMKIKNDEIIRELDND